MHTHLIGRWISVAASLLVIGTSVPAAVAAPAAQGAADAKTLVVGAAFDIKSLDPARGFEQIGGMVHKATYDTLVTLDDNDVSKIVPDLAQSWDVSPDAKTFTFHLRPGVKFQTSGNPLTSADVKWSWDRAIGIKGNPSFLFDGITSVETPDALTVKVTKTDPDPAFIAKGSFPAFAPLDSKTVQAHGGTSGPDANTTDTAEQWLNQNSAGTGPFIMTKYTQDSEVDVQKFTGYWKGDAAFDRVIYRNIPEAATQKLTLQAGDIDIATEVSPDAVADLQSNSQLKVVQGVGADIFFLLMNENPALTSGAMSNPVVQNAVRYALDYDGINALVGGPAATPPSILPLGFLGAYTADHAFKRDVAMATSLLGRRRLPEWLQRRFAVPDEFLAQRRELRHRRPEDPVGPCRRGHHRHAETGRDQHRAGQLPGRDRGTRFLAVGARLLRLQRLPGVSARGYRWQARRLDQRELRRRDPAIARPDQRRDRQREAGPTVATGAGLPDAERSVRLSRPARHLHRHAREHRELRLQPAMAGQSVHSHKVVGSSGQLSVDSGQYVGRSSSRIGLHKLSTGISTDH